jgi:hypothetical protein
VVHNNARFDETVNMNRLVVSGNSNFDGIVEFDDEIIVKNDASFNETVYSKKLVILNDASFNQKVDVSNLIVRHDASFNKQVDISGLSVNHDVSLNGNVNLHGDFDLESYVYWYVTSNLSSISLNNYDIIPYNTISYDTLGKFDNLVGYKYTVTKKGLYMLNASCSVTYNCNIQIMVYDENGENTIAKSPNTGTQDTSTINVCAVSTIYYLNENQEVYVRIFGSTTSDSINDKSTYFTGYRLPSY